MRLIKFRTEDTTVTALAGDAGRIYTPLVWIDVPLRLHKIPNGDVERYARPIEKPSVRKAALTMLRAGRNLGITKGAKRFLQECRRGA